MENRLSDLDIVMNKSGSKKIAHFFSAMKQSKISDPASTTISAIKSSVTTESRKSNDYISQFNNVKSGLEQIFKGADASLAKFNKDGIIRENFTPVQKKIAEMAYDIAAKGKQGLAYVGTISMGEGKAISTEGFRHNTSVDINTLLPQNGYPELSTEKFGSQELNNIITNTVTLAVAASGQSKFDALIFPIVPVDPLINRYVTTVNYSLFGRPFNRFSGDVAQNKDPEEYELVLSLFEKEKFKDDYIAVKPVVGKKQNKIDDNTILVVNAAETIPNYKGYSNVTIAPFKVGKRIDIIGASQCEAELATHTRDYTDVLDRVIKLNSLFLKSSETAVENKYIKLDTRYSKNITFSKREEGSNTGMSVAFNKEYSLNTKTAVDFRNPDDPSKGQFFGASADELTLTFKAHFNCEIEHEKGRVESSSGSLVLISVTNSTGTFTEGTEFKKGEELLAKLSIEGFYIDATLTNTNFKDKGIQGKVKSESYTIGIGNKSSIGLTGEVAYAQKEGNQSDYDLFTIEAQATYVEQQMSGDAVDKLFEYIQILKEAKENNTIANFKTDNMSEHFVLPYYNEVDIDLTKVVDSIKSSERLEDIRAALLNIIKYYVNMMDINSKYRNAVQEVFKTNKRCVAAMVNSELAMILNSDNGPGNTSERIPLTQDVDLIVAQSYYEKEFANKIILSYVTPDFNSAEGTPYLNVACTMFSPMTNYTVDSIMRNGGVVRELHNILRYEHVFNLPVFTVLNIENVAKVLEKCIYFTQVK